MCSRYHSAYTSRSSWARSKAIDEESLVLLPLQWRTASGSDRCRGRVLQVLRIHTSSTAGEGDSQEEARHAFLVRQYRAVPCLLEQEEGMESALDDVKTIYEGPQAAPHANEFSQPDERRRSSIYGSVRDTSESILPKTTLQFAQEGSVQRRSTLLSRTRFSMTEMEE